MSPAVSFGGGAKRCQCLAEIQSVYGQGQTLSLKQQLALAARRPREGERLHPALILLVRNASATSTAAMG